MSENVTSNREIFDFLKKYLLPTLSNANNTLAPKDNNSLSSYDDDDDDGFTKPSKSIIEKFNDTLSVANNVVTSASSIFKKIGNAVATTYNYATSSKTWTVSSVPFTQLISFKRNLFHIIDTLNKNLENATDNEAKINLYRVSLNQCRVMLETAILEKENCEKYPRDVESCQQEINEVSKSYAVEKNNFDKAFTEIFDIHLDVSAQITEKYKEYINYSQRNAFLGCDVKKSGGLNDFFIVEPEIDFDEISRKNENLLRAQLNNLMGIQVKVIEDIDLGILRLSQIIDNLKEELNLIEQIKMNGGADGIDITDDNIN